jgi:hypothetical protein
VFEFPSEASSTIRARAANPARTEDERISRNASDGRHRLAARAGQPCWGIPPDRPLRNPVSAGMNAELVTATAIVYSDLVSRSAALNVLNIGTEPWPRTDPDVVRFFDALRRGSLVARAYPTDLTAARTLAATSPPIMRARPDSRAAAALAIHSALIKVANGCGAADGAPVLRRLAPIAWRTTVTSDGRRHDGSVGGLAFHVAYAAGSGWIEGVLRRGGTPLDPDISGQDRR